MGNRTPKICVELRGGLGNQLFGWATAFALSRRTQTPLELLSRSISARIGAADPRNFELDYFGLYSREVNPERRDSQSLFPWLRHARERVVIESSFEFDPRILEIKEPVTLKGYFQSPLYFEDLRDEIVSFLWENAHVDAEVTRMADEFGHNWTAVHVRRGDYERLQNVYTLPSADYYRDCLEAVRRNSGTTKSVVFSDNVDIARKLVPGAFQYVGPSDLPRVGDSLMLMAMATNIVGANSSLSWWAAYLQPQNLGLKVFPHPWFVGDSPSAKDLVMAHWTTMAANP